ncbi:MAG: arylamine N-acetyltransferase [Planctomycetota bacterium]|jgi:N-hydroxyarylamine O-acetyltransferase
MAQNSDRSVGGENGGPGLALRQLRALGLEGGEPTLELLTQIVRRQVAVFAFSSMGVRLNEPLPLEPEQLFDRIVVRRRGGYCFEHNGLLFAVLSELGYDVTIRLARVINNGDHLPPLTHRIAHVCIDDVTYVVDAGFGPAGPAVPVAMPMPGESTPAQWLGDRPHRVIERRPGEFHMQQRQVGGPFSLYRFDLGTYGQADCELGHFYSHRHPQAVFVNNLVASRILDTEIRSLRNHSYRVLRAKGHVDTEIREADHLGSVLRDDFELHVTNDEARRLFAGLPAR